MKKTIRFFALILSVCAAVSSVSSVSATAVGDAYLAPNGTEYQNSQNVDQKFTLEKKGDNYYDVNKVKVEWEVSDVAVTYKDGKVWNPNELTWDDPQREELNAESGKGIFTVTNLSSEEMNVNITFTAENGFTAPTLKYTVDGAEKTEGKAAIASVVKADKTVDKTLDHDVKIEIEVTAVADDFKTLADTAGSQFGKYTIVISDKKPQ